MFRTGVFFYVLSAITLVIVKLIFMMLAAIPLKVAIFAGMIAAVVVGVAFHVAILVYADLTNQSSGKVGSDILGTIMVTVIALPFIGAFLMAIR